MFRAISNWFRTLSHFVSGRVDDSARGMQADPHAMRSQYDDIIRDKSKRIQQYKDAVAGLIAQQETKMSTLKGLSEDVARLEELKAGALAKAQSTVASMQENGASMEAIKADPDYQKCLNAFNDFTSTVKEKQARITELESDIQDYGKRIQEHKLQLTDLIKEIDKLRSERSDAVADVIGAQQERELNDALTGIGEDTTDAKLSELRNMRQEMKAGARISRELSGAEQKTTEAEFLEYARKNAASSEFDQLIGLAETKDAPTPAAEATPSESATKDGPTSLPE